MKKLTWQIVFPLTILLFLFFTKWWYTIPVDAPETFFYGFPFPFVCNGWHTSGSLQIFFIELFADLLIYFILCFAVIFCIHKYIRHIKISRLPVAILYCIIIPLIVFHIWIGSFKENIYYLKRDFDMQVYKTGYKFFWQSVPDYSIYHP
jgi:hypothetical protein